MKDTDVSGWEELEAELKKLRAESDPGSPFLFRGQSNSSWSLTTTLERAGKEGMAYCDYYRLIGTVKPAIESLTDHKWSFPDYSLAMEKSFQDYDEFARFPRDEVYNYLVYLRHHGFPSPLLDWSHTPQVAAFFAFADAGAAENCSIFAYRESFGIKTRTSTKPQMRRIGPYVQTDPRHFRQQSDYTICGGFDTQWSFRPHDEVFLANQPSQDVLWKFNIPTAERNKVLTLLNEYNLNAFSLFGSEESLMQTLWFKEVTIPDSARVPAIIATHKTPIKLRDAKSPENK